MRFGPTLICSLLLASAALADPLEHPDQLSSYTRSGVMVGRQVGTFQANKGIITMQNIEGPPGTSISAWVGIDGDKCNNFLRAGINFTAEPPSYTAWYEWYPNTPVLVENFIISAGDDIRIYVGVYDGSMSSGYVQVEHANDPQGARNYFLQPGHKLCGESAEWILGNDRLEYGVPSQDKITAVLFTDAVASGPDNQSYGPLDGDKIEMVDTNGTPMTIVASRSENSLVVVNPSRVY